MITHTKCHLRTELEHEVDTQDGGDYRFFHLSRSDALGTFLDHGFSSSQMMAVQMNQICAFQR
jgi:hypothetical protein